MRLASKGGIGIWERQRFRLFRLYKRCYQFLHYRPGQPKTVLLVAGCQRSGTSMLEHLFRLDRRSVTYDEYSPLSSGDTHEGVRWNAWSEVKARIEADRAPLVVTKPLVESQNLGDLLDLFTTARAIWMYRPFEDVTASSLKYFSDGNSQRDLGDILVGDPASWRAQHLDPAVAEFIRSRCRPGLSAEDAGALFWYARNSLFFSRSFDQDPRIRLCRYDDVVAAPADLMRRAYEFAGSSYPGDHIVGDVNAGFRGRGEGMMLSDPVREACQELLDRLDGQQRL